MRRKRLIDSDGSSWTWQDPQSVPRQRQRLRSQQGSGARADTQMMMVASSDGWRSIRSCAAGLCYSN